MPVTLRRLGIAALAALALGIAASPLAGCGAKAPQAASGSIRVGYVPSEDCLTLWVAERDGIAKEAGLALTLTAFATAEERDAALAQGNVDAVAGDVVSAARMRVAGQPVRIATVLLGASPEQGRYGIAVKPKSGTTSLVQLAGKPVATSRGTLEHYVAESLLLFEGLGPVEIKTKAVKDPQARLDALVAGEHDAAVLPGPQLALAEKRGAKVIADDTHDVNFSQGVLVVSERFLDTTDGVKATRKLLEVLGTAAKAVDAAPESFRPLLVERLPLLEPVRNTYVVSAYPQPGLPVREDVEMVLDWMTRAELQKGDLVYEAFIWSPDGNVAVPPPSAPEDELVP